MKRAAAAFLMLVLLACEEESSTPIRVDWKKLGLDGKTVNEMKIAANGLYVATTTGLFKMAAASTEFQSIGFTGENVEAIEILGEGNVMVSVFDKTGAEPPGLFITEDDGVSWNRVASDFGGGLQEPIFDLETHPEDNTILFATGYGVIASSHDEGRTWQPLYGEWGGFATGLSVIEVNPVNNELWAGGQGAIENGILLHSTDGSDWQSWGDLVENPTVVKEITFSPTEEGELFVGFEGALLKSTDYGDNWQTLIHSEETRFFFGICLDPHNPEHVYTGGWLKTPDPQPLVIFLSKDGGTTWTEARHASEQYGGILDMQIKTENGRDVIFIGLDKGGVYQVTLYH